MPWIDSRWARARTASQRVQRACEASGNGCQRCARPQWPQTTREPSTRPIQLCTRERPRDDALPGPWPAAIIRVAARQAAERGGGADFAGGAEPLLGGALDGAAYDRIEARQQHERREGAGADEA